MVYTCFLCKWRSDKEPRRSFHQFPVKTNERQHWLDIMGQSNAVIGNRASICMVHFEDNCFRYGLIYGRKYLKAGSCPSLHLVRKEEKENTSAVSSMDVSYSEPSMNTIQQNYTNKTAAKSELSTVSVQQNYTNKTATKRIGELSESEIPKKKMSLETLPQSFDVLIKLQYLENKVKEQKKTISLLKRQICRLKKGRLTMKAHLQKLIKQHELQSKEIKLLKAKLQNHTISKKKKS